MRVSNNWLNELVNTEDDINNIANKMLFVGNEYDSINKLCPCTNLVVGYVKERKNHPDSDHLNVCMVDLGDKVYQIVCGASNVDAGEKVIVAKVGAELPGGVIKKSNIRGVESNGMICSLAELGLESKYIKEEDKKGIHILPEDAPIGVDAISYLEFNDSYVDYELTANRGDLLSMIGMAHEVGAIYNKEINFPTIKLNESNELTSNYIAVDSKTDKCYAYYGRVVKNVEIKESPAYIKARLMSSGIRPINNVVDISNYVMMEYGCPLHFFDLDKLGNNVVVRCAKENEKMITLDGVERQLKDTDIVITDGNVPVALAGVMGGMDTEVTKDTKNIFIECAIFDPYTIRKTSKEILRSEASIRFEKGIDPNQLENAINRSAYLLQEYANGCVLKDIVGFNDKELDDKKITISLDKINKVLGMSIEKDEVIDIYTRLGFKVNEKNGIFDVEVPTRRLDINIKEDLIEEIGRMHGYDKMIGSLPITHIKKGAYIAKNKFIKDLKKRLSCLSLNEVITYSLVNSDEVKLFKDNDYETIKVLSALTEDKSIMRYSLIPSLLKVADYNISRNIKDINIYEISKVYYKDETYKEENKLCILMSGLYLKNSWNDSVKVDFYLLKGILENLINYIGIGSRYRLVPSNSLDYHPGICADIIVDNELVGHIGRVHPNINKNDIYVCEMNLDKLYDIKTGKIKFKEIPKYPSVTKDVAFIFDNDVNSGDVINTIIKKGSKIIKNATVFDLYKDIIPGKKSLAFKIVFEDITKTLTDDEVNDAFNKVISIIEKDYNATIRNK